MTNSKDDRCTMYDKPEAPCGECGRPTNREYIDVEALSEFILRERATAHSHRTNAGVFETEQFKKEYKAKAQGMDDTLNALERFIEDRKE